LHSVAIHIIRPSQLKQVLQYCLIIVSNYCRHSEWLF